VIAQGTQFSLNDVEVVSATVDIEDVRSYRGRSSRNMQAAESGAYPRVEVEGTLSDGKHDAVLDVAAARAFTVIFHTPEEEIAYVSLLPFILDVFHLIRSLGTSLGPACWLWDYLRRSRTQGYFLPLSGGIDSCATAVIVSSMCRIVAEAARRGGPSHTV
jgi:NAD+ synthase (glutamine-hydrolysing)